ncbi:homeobox protein CDX-1-like [Schistocerca piceifrons]|uniref:homeobox protein CDX-1-like n=1 Tax=Schistocerca piceifrons TaxID=274613 RepID=UPI001F5FDEEB|nr:homeobox protein CDX-1-like [Schistocerca piceifrons]XP_049938247.1 homeobox protein CDX-1-like [Schistocerca serialis cubense]
MAAAATQQQVEAAGFLLLFPEEPREAARKTRTKDKYRVVYSDHQRLELEKEFHYSRYITIRRKAELAANLGLSERQVKIWFQNRRAKERKQVKKREELLHKEKMEAVQQLHAAQQQPPPQPPPQQPPPQQQQPVQVQVQVPPPHCHAHAHALAPVM